MKRRFLPVFLVLFVLAALLSPIVEGQSNPDYCEDGSNVLPNCGFSSGMEPWKPFVEGGSPSITWGGDSGTCHVINPPCVRISSENAYVGGIYQQVSGLTSGVTYSANVTLIWMDSLNKTSRVMGRKIGVDPKGGTNPQSSDIVWSEEIWGTEEERPSVTQSKLHASAVAQGSTVTVFVRVDAPRQVNGQTWPGVDQLWIDDVGMIPGGQAAAPTNTSAPTDTPVPSTNTPAPTRTAKPPTDIPPAATATPTVLQATPTVTPTNTSTAAPTTTPTTAVTPTSTVQPTSTATPRPTATATKTPFFSLGDLPSTAFLLVGLVAFCGAGLLTSVLLFIVWWTGGNTTEDETAEEAEE